MWQSSCLQWEPPNQDIFREAPDIYAPPQKSNKGQRRPLLPFSKGSPDRYGVKDHIDSYIGNSFLLILRNAQSFKGR